jgi:hypothetical protein
VAVRWDGRYEELDLGSRFDFLSPADGVWDASSGALRFSTGPEIGLGPYGIDAGYLMRIDGGELRHGFTIRPIMTIGIASIAGRYGHVFGADRGAHFGEVSVLLKFPIVLAGDPW